MDNKYIIYKYISPSGKIYIGQTCRTIFKRAGSNGTEYKGSPHFYQAIQKYGLDNFRIDLLKWELTAEEADYWEIYYINAYQSNNKEYGYNILPGGSGFKYTELFKDKVIERMKNNNPMFNPEVCKKVHDKQRGVPRTEQARRNTAEGHKKKVQCIETGTIYPSRNEAGQAVGVDGTNIGRACKGEFETSAGYHWRYVCD